MSENVGILSTPNSTGPNIQLSDKVEIRDSYLLNFTHTQNRKRTVIQNNSSDMVMYIFGGTDNTIDEDYEIIEPFGAYLALRGKNENSAVTAGAFSLNAINPITNERYQFNGMGDGRLMWKSGIIPTIIKQEYLGNGNWYRQWDDGFIEQGGTGEINSIGDYSKVVNLYKPYESTIYTIQLTELSESYAGVNTLGVYGSKRTKESFTILINNIGANSASGFIWYCAGY